MPDPTLADYARLKQENERLWLENSKLRPLISELQLKLSVALRHLKAHAEADTEILLKDDHG